MLALCERCALRAQYLAVLMRQWGTAGRHGVGADSSRLSVLRRTARGVQASRLRPPARPLGLGTGQARSAESRTGIALAANLVIAAAKVGRRPGHQVTRAAVRSPLGRGCS